MLKGLWILDETGPALFQLIIDNRFFEVNENLITGFFAALDTFAKTIGSEEVAKLDLKDVTFSFIRSSNAIIVLAADKYEDVTQTLLKIRHTFGEVIPLIKKSPFNPSVPSDLRELEDKLTPKIKGILASASGRSRGGPSGVEGYMVPKLQKPMSRALGERDQLVNRFGIVAIDIVCSATGRQTVAKIATTLKLEQSKVEDVLAFAQKLGVIDFEPKGG
jgi:hypothetical protein